jgi:hypothetical protein
MNQIDRLAYTSTVSMQANSPPTAAFNGGNASELSFKALRVVLSPSKTTAPPALTFCTFVGDVGDVADRPTSTMYGFDVGVEIGCKGGC